MVGPGALKPKVGDGIKSRRPLSAPVLHSFILLFFFFVLCLLLHLYWCVYNNNIFGERERPSLVPRPFLRTREEFEIRGRRKARERVWQITSTSHGTVLRLVNWRIIARQLECERGRNLCNCAAPSPSFTL